MVERAQSDAETELASVNHGSAVTTLEQIVALFAETISPEYVADVDELVEEYISPSYWSLFVHDATDPAGQAPIQTVTELTDPDDVPDIDVAGAAIVGTLSQEQLREHFIGTVTPVESYPFTADEYPLTLGKTVAVDPAWRGNQIAFRLFQVGFERVERFEDCFPEEFRCVTCGIDEPCHCSQVLYARET